MSAPGFFRIVRPVRTLIDPRPQQPDLPRRKPLTFRRHHRIGFQSGHEMNQSAARTFPRLNDPARIPAPQGPRLPIQAQIRLLLFRAVTFHAPLRQQRLNIPREINLRTRRRGKLGKVGILRRSFRTAHQRINPWSPQQHRHRDHNQRWQQPFGFGELHHSLYSGRFVLFPMPASCDRGKIFSGSDPLRAAMLHAAVAVRMDV